MRFPRMSVVTGAVALAVLAAACGGGDEGGAPSGSSGGGGTGAQFTGRAPQATPTLAAAQAEATQKSVIQYQGGYGGSSQTEPLTTTEAADAIGKTGTVCGLVVSSFHDPDHPYQITVLSFENTEDPVFFVYFWNDPLRIGTWPDKADRSIDLTSYFNDRKLCVDGRIEHYKGKPAINANYWHQYEFQEE